MKYEALRAAEMAKIKAIQDLAKAEDRVTTKAEMATIDGHLAKAKEYAELAKAEIAQQALIDAEIASLDAPVPPQSLIDPKTQVIEVGKALWEKDPKYGYETPAIFLKEIIDVSTHKAKASDQLKFLMAAGSDEQQTMDDASGGFLVPRGFLATLLKVTPEADPTVDLVFNIPMDSPSVDIPVRVDKDHSKSVAGGVEFFWATETQPNKETKAKFALVNLKAHDLVGITYATEQIMMDSAITFSAIISENFTEARGDKILRAKLDGDGVGKPQGVRNTKSLITVAKKASQTTPTIITDNIFDMRERAWGYQNAIWMINHNCLGQIMRLKDDDGRLIWQPPITADAPETLLGRPLVISEYMQPLGQKFDIAILNWSQYLFGTMRGGQQLQESIHVRFIELERTFRFFERLDAKSWWTSPLIPVNGGAAASRSPWVTLAERLAA